MIVRERDFADIYDLVGVRVLVDSVRDCYATLGTIHANWQPVPGRFKDYIAMPKFNMYQSLHTTVIGPEGKPVELQIRTYDMHHRAEYGIAAHWKYKEGASGGHQPASEVNRPTGLTPAPPDKGDQLAWLRQMLDWQRETSDPSEFLDSLRFDLQGSEVFVFTPKGDVVSLPSGSTPVDYAYAVHTEVGHRCIGARVNGRLVPLESPLDNGDTVEIFTSKSPTAGPSRDWMTFVRSGRARSKIRQWFAKERREDAIEEGRDAILRAMRKQGLPLQRLLARRRADRRWRRRCATPTSPRCTRPSARATSARRPSSTGWCSPSAGPRARSRTSPRRRSRAPSARCRAPTPASSSRARATSG